MRIITANLNGIRSAINKGFLTWAAEQDADVICLQETKAQEHQLDGLIHLAGYDFYCVDAGKKGYSGVAIYTRHKPDKITRGLGWEIADNEGRYIQADFGPLSIVSVYMPSGTSGPERQAIKFAFMEQFEQFLQKTKKQKREFIICGDWNIAHKPIDLKNWRGNQKNSGFLPEERAWLDKVFGDMQFIDAFRAVNQEPEQYTWWSNRGQAWAKNVGWRIDYQVTTPGFQDKITAVSIYKDQRFSDHAPLIMDYDYTL